MQKSLIRGIQSLMIFITLFAISCSKTVVVPQVVAPQELSSVSGDSKDQVEFAKNKVFPTLVTIHAFPEQFSAGRKVKGGSSGSGAIVDSRGYLITNAHVVQDAEKFLCQLSNKEEVSAIKVGEDLATDIAVLKLNLAEAKNFSPVPVAKFGRSSELIIGDVVIAMGSPLGLTQTLTMGVVSNNNRQAGSTTGEGFMRLGRSRTGQYTNWIQHDASINPGNSGGPLVNLRGEIIGVNAVKMGGDDLGLAIPSDLAEQIYREIVRHGRVIRNHLGFSCATIQETGESEGILVINVEDNSPAGKAGLKAGDFIVAFDGAPVTAKYAEDLPPFYRMASEYPINKEVTLLVKRDGDTEEIRYVTEELESDWAEEKEFRAWGMTAANISPYLERLRGFANREGVYVTGTRDIASRVKPSLNNRVIKKIGDKVIKNLDDFKEAYKQYAQKEDRYQLVFEYTNGQSDFLGVLKHTGKKAPDLQDAKRPWVGIDSQVFVTDLKRALNIKEKIQGIRITRIFPNTLAEKGKLKVGDVITHVDGKPIRATKETHTQVFPTLLHQHSIGDTVPFKVYRNGEILTVDVELETAPTEPRYMKKADDKNFELSVRELTFYDIIRNRWEKNVEGLIVTKTDPHGWVGYKMKSGDLILSIGGQTIKTIDDFETVMKLIEENKKERVKFYLRRRSTKTVVFVEPEWEE